MKKTVISFFAAASLMLAACNIGGGSSDASPVVGLIDFIRLNGVGVNWTATDTLVANHDVLTLVMGANGMYSTLVSCAAVASDTTAQVSISPSIDDHTYMYVDSIAPGYIHFVPGATLIASFTVNYIPMKPNPKAQLAIVVTSASTQYPNYGAALPVPAK